MTELRPVLTDLGLVEAPRWHDDRLVFSDWGARTVLALDQKGRTETLATVDGMLPFCTDRRPDGRLLVLTQAGLMSREPDSTLALYADLGGLSDYAWNDIVVDGRGNCYVNNIGFEFGGGATGGSGGVPPGVNTAPGLIALVTSDGSVRQVADGLAFPNGMAVTPDNSTLIVAESYGGVLTGYDIDDDGSLSAAGSGPIWPARLRTGSALTPRGRSGSPRYLASAAYAWPRAVKSARRSTPTLVVSPACWAVQTAAPCTSPRQHGRTR